MPDWSKLTHAYGYATDTPGLLAKLRPDSRKTFEQLWFSLCHQGSVYPASFAALPSLLECAERWNPGERLDVLCLAGAILISPDVQEGCRSRLLAPVDFVVRRFQAVAAESLTDAKWRQFEFIQLLQAERALAGDDVWGTRLDYLSDDEVPGICPKCDEYLHLLIGSFGFLSSTDWLCSKSAVLRPIRPCDGMLPYPGDLLWRYAVNADQVEVATRLTYAFGNSNCPFCGDEFDVAEAISL